MVRDGLCSIRAGKSRDRRGNMMKEIRVIFVRPYLRSMVEAVVQVILLYLLYSDFSECALMACPGADT